MKMRISPRTGVAADIHQPQDAVGLEEREKLFD
jgi:hypothetical protein